MDYNKEIVGPGDRFSEVARQICLDSHDNNNLIEIISGGDGLRAADLCKWNDDILRRQIDDGYADMYQSDGAGGKPQFFTLLNSPEAFRYLGWEPITMNADDVACRGGLPAMICASNIDVKMVTDENWGNCIALLEGFADALNESRLIMMTGETAIMKQSITAFCDNGDPEQLILTWGATCKGLGAVNMELDGPRIRPNQVIIGLRDKGYRCNGGSKLVSLLMETWGPNLSDVMTSPEAMRFVELATEPSRSYAQTIAYLNGWNPDGSIDRERQLITGAAHVTGGGVWSKLAGVLPDGVGAKLAFMPEPPEILKWAQSLSTYTNSPISDYDCYGDFHGGCGMMLFCDELDALAVKQVALDHGHDASMVGYTTSSYNSEIEIESRLANGGTLSSTDL